MNVLIVILTLACMLGVQPVSGQDPAPPHGRSVAHGSSERIPPYLGMKLIQNFISSVDVGSPVEEAGMVRGDQVVTLNGQPVSSTRDVVMILRALSAGDLVTFEVKRRGELLTYQVVLGARVRNRGEESALDSSRYYVRTEAALPRKLAIRDGMKWLASQQMENGMIPAEAQNSSRFHVAVTALSGLALLYDDHYRRHTDRIAQFLIQNMNEDGLILYQKPNLKTMWEHGFATQFLGEYLIKARADERQDLDLPLLESALGKAVELILYAQNSQGGWGYRPDPDPHAETGPGAAMLDALHIAQHSGREIPVDRIGLGLRSQVALLKDASYTLQGEWRSFTYEARAFTLASLLGWSPRPETALYWNQIQQVGADAYFLAYTEVPPAPGAYWVDGLHTLGLFYSSLAIQRMPEEARPDEWHQKVSRQLTKRQLETGQWKGWFGDTYGTAFALLTLQSADSPLSMFTGVRKQEASQPQNLRLSFPDDLEQDIRLMLDVKDSQTRYRQDYERILSVCRLKDGVSEITLDREDLLSFFQKSPGLYDRTQIGNLQEVSEKEEKGEEHLFHLGEVWVIPQEVGDRLFEPLSPVARSELQAELAEVTEDRIRLKLAGLVKFGEPGFALIQTNALLGELVYNRRTHQVTSFHLNSVRGCVRVQRAGGYHVALSDVQVHLRASTHAEDKSTKP